MQTVYSVLRPPGAENVSSDRRSRDCFGQRSTLFDLQPHWL